MSPNTEITIINSNSRSYLHYQQGLLPCLIKPSFVRTDEAKDRLRDDAYPSAKWKNSQAQNEVARVNISMY
jgi:hypothetical protein